MKPFEDTLKCKAHFYLDDSGSDLSRQKFLEELFVNIKTMDYAGYMLYIGGGFNPLAVAVIARDESDAIEIMEEWARKTGMEDVIGEDDEWKKDVAEDPNIDAEYELDVQVIPIPVVVMM